MYVWRTFGVRFPLTQCYNIVRSPFGRYFDSGLYRGYIQKEIDEFFRQFANCAPENILPWSVYTEKDIALYRQDHLQKLQARKEKPTCKIRSFN